MINKLGSNIKPYYTSENVLIFHGNCRDIIRSFSMQCKIGLIATDPPYLFQSSGGGMYKNDEQMKAIKKLGTDTFNFQEYIPNIISIQDFWCNYINAYFCCNKSLVRDYLNIAYAKGCIEDILILRKDKSKPAHNTHYTPDLEYVIFMRKGKPVFNGEIKENSTWLYSKVYDYDSSMLKHPNEKPLDFMKKLILISSNPGDIVLDPFGGSGTTAVACQETDRRCIIIDKDKTCCDIMVGKLQQGSLL